MNFFSEAQMKIIWKKSQIFFLKWHVNGENKGGVENDISVLLWVNASFSENA